VRTEATYNFDETDIPSLFSRTNADITRRTECLPIPDLREVQPMTVKVAILQSSYIPWKGYFDQINAVDHFVLYDDVQYTRRDWRNRNIIKTQHGPHWLSIPVKVKGQYFQKIREVEILDPHWAKEHYSTIKHHYSKARFYDQYESELESLYLRAANLQMLSQVNHLFLSQICSWLGIKTPLRWSHDFRLDEGKSERLLQICKQLDATHYISGPAAKDYLDVSCFTRENIEVEWADYSGYPEYHQLNPPFDHKVTILDLILNEGSDAATYMKSFNRSVLHHTI
jgi:hypothetical protein